MALSEEYIRKIELLQSSHTKRMYKKLQSVQYCALPRELDFFCKFNHSMTKYHFSTGMKAGLWLSCHNCNIARILRHVKGGLA